MTNFTCELCQASQGQIVSKIGKIGRVGEYGSLPIVMCGRCGLVQFLEKKDESFYEDYYSKLYRQVAFGSVEPTEVYVDQQIARSRGVLNWVLSSKSKLSVFNGNPLRLLDHGCAAGFTMKPWIEKGFLCKGIDPHVPSVSKGQKAGLDVSVGAGESLPFSDESFDVVLSLGSLEHVYNLTDSLDEIFRVLANSGVLIIRWRSDQIFGSPLEYFNLNHFRYFTESMWRRTLERFGFSIVAESDEAIEGWSNYKYLIAVKNGRQVYNMSVAPEEEKRSRVSYLNTVLDSYKERAMRLKESLTEDQPASASKILSMLCPGTDAKLIHGTDVMTAEQRMEFEMLKFLDFFGE